MAGCGDGRAERFQVKEEDDKLRRFWRAPEFWLLLAAVFASVLGLTGWIVIPLLGNLVRWIWW
jgi:hypothetical protein